MEVELVEEQEDLIPTELQKSVDHLAEVVMVVVT
jgi:hypothetical protein